MKLAWLTDIHLDFLTQDKREKFYASLVEAKPNAILISGDIAEFPALEKILKEITVSVDVPIYFVLGNHDYYRGEIATVRQCMTKLTKQEPLLHWLPATEPIVLQEGIILLGQDGWADGRFGNYANSRVSLNDSRMIFDLFQEKLLGKYPLLDKMQQLADNDAEQLHKKLQQAVDQHQPQKIIILTHVPPFKETCLYENKISNDDYLPYFASQVSGEVLVNFAEKNPTLELLVLCGHTHHACTYQALDNLLVRVGQAEYFHPGIQEMIEEI